MGLGDWLVALGVPTIISSIVVFIFTKVVNNYSAKRGDNLLLKQGVQAILRDRLQQAYRFFISQGYAELPDKQNFDNMYQKYHALGQNGVMDEVYKEVMALPTSKPKDN